jgi:hypothetical protein
MLEMSGAANEMAEMIYGSFARHGVAARLAARLNAGDRGATFAIAHARHLAEEEIQHPGTLALPFAVVGAFMVATTVACMSALVMWPFLDLPPSWAAFGCMALIAAPFGVLAGMLSGSAACRPRLAALAARSEHAARTLVTAMIPSHSIRRTIAAFAAAGGREVGVA